MTTTLRKEQLTQEILREYLAYNETTGMLTWSKKPNTKCNVNCRAGSFNKNTGYRNITLFGKGYPEHHVIWCWYHGYWPKHQIDHEDHNRTNNAIDNYVQHTISITPLISHVLTVLTTSFLIQHPRPANLVPKGNFLNPHSKDVLLALKIKNTTIL